MLRAIQFYKSFRATIIIMVGLISFCIHAAAQKENRSYRADRQIQYLTKELSVPHDSVGYSIFLPTAPPVGAVVFFGNTAYTKDNYADESDMIIPALQKQLAVIFLSSGKIIDFYFHDTDLKRADSILNLATTHHQIPKNRLLLCGLSLAGTRAMRYAMYCMDHRANSKIMPRAIAISDAPLDMIRFWGEESFALEVQHNQMSAGEARFVLPLLEKHLGKPQNTRSYFSYSPFCYSAPKGGNIHKFKNIAIRAYHEPDINWWIQNRGKDYYSMNSLDMAAMINRLQLLGNKKAELVTTVSKRKNIAQGVTPHTWSFVDNEPLVTWFLQQ